MAVTCGFYDSKNGDRKYYAKQFGDMFEGLINDGIFATVGQAMMVSATSGMVITVGSGHAWFNKTWTDNDSPLPLIVEQSELILSRIDAVVLEVDTSVEVRNNTIKIIKGTPATIPANPTLTNTETCHQYLLAYINVDAEVTEIKASDITNHIGLEGTPFVTGIIDTISIDGLVAKWEGEWEDWSGAMMSDMDRWANEEKLAFQAFMTEFQNEMNKFEIGSETDFNTWFDHVKGQLSTDVAGNLQNQLDDINKELFMEYYEIKEKETTVNKDVNGITQSIVEVSDEATATTTFATTDNGKSITTIIVPITGAWNYTKNVLIKQDGFNKVITETYTRNAKG